MGILARQSRARPALPASAPQLTFSDIQDVQVIARFVPLLTDRNVHPALPVYNAGVEGPSHGGTDDAIAPAAW